MNHDEKPVSKLSLSFHYKQVYRVGDTCIVVSRDNHNGSKRMHIYAPKDVAISRPTETEFKEFLAKRYKKCP